MNDENKSNYYAIIPATVRYDNELKPAEKLLYGEVTALANKNGFCYAQNKYFAELYNVTNGTVSKWLSHLQQLGYIIIKLNRNDKQEIISRHIYINDLPYSQKKLYPYGLKCSYPMVENDKDNNINKYNEDELFFLIINNSNKISNDFYKIIEKLEFNYTSSLLSYMKEDKIKMLKDIIYILYQLYNGDFAFLLSQISRDSLLNLYNISKEHQPIDFLNYYKKLIINKYTNNST